LRNEQSVSDGTVTSVFIIAASDVVRAGLESLLTVDSGVSLAGGAANWTSAFTPGSDDDLPDIVLFDTGTHGKETPDVLPSWIEDAGENQHVPAVIIIGAEREEWLQEALRSGVVRATLTHAASGSEIMATVAAVANGLLVFDPESFAALLSPGRTALDDATRSGERSLDDLTPREREVLDMLAEGLSNKEIAWRMKISEHTVKFHVASIFAKLDASTRTEAVMHGIRKGLIMM
jgi:two-component system, NarL family, response regulator YdfI